MFRANFGGIRVPKLRSDTLAQDGPEPRWSDGAPLNGLIDWFFFPLISEGNNPTGPDLQLHPGPILIPG